MVVPEPGLNEGNDGDKQQESEILIFKISPVAWMKPDDIPPGQKCNGNITSVIPF